MADNNVETDETDRLIASNKVEGTAVYDREGNKLGSVYNFMVDKRSGKAEYAVMSFGGFLGMGDDYLLPSIAVVLTAPETRIPLLLSSKLK